MSKRIKTLAYELLDQVSWGKALGFAVNVLYYVIGFVFWTFAAVALFIGGMYSGSRGKR